MPHTLPSTAISLHEQDKSTSGQALAEIIFALAMAILLISGMVVAVRAGLSNSQYSQHKVQAVYLAQESIEKVHAQRNISDTQSGWNKITNSYILSNQGTFGHTGLLDSDGYVKDRFGNDTIFRREVVVLDNDDENGDSANYNAKRVTARVSWDEFDRKVFVELTTVLTDHE
jgi:hypothetical protein